MKTIFTLLISFLCTIELIASPIEKSHVGKDAKWVVHIDVDQFSDSSLGKFAMNELRAMIKKETNGLPFNLDVEAVFQDLNSITAYGTSFGADAEKSSVLIFSSGEQLQAIIDSCFINEELKQEQGSSSNIVALSGTPYRTYLVDKEVYVAFPSQNYTVVSKSLDRITAAMEVISGKEESLEDSDSDIVLHQQNGFFFVASVQGLNDIENVPPQARILKKATGGQLSIGEDEENIITQLILSTHDSETSTQLARIVQGMVALISFVDIKEAKLDELAQSIVVSNEGPQVEIDLSLPFVEFERLIELAKTEKSKSMKKKRGRLERSDFHEEVDDSMGGELLKIISVDALSDDGNVAVNAIDNNQYTRWSTHGTGQWIRFELEKKSLIREIAIAWHKGDIRISKFSVEVSEDGVVWTRLINKESTGTTDQFEGYNVPDTESRWVRLKCYGNTINAWNSIKDVQILGTPISSGDDS